MKKCMLRSVHTSADGVVTGETTGCFFGVFTCGLVAVVLVPEHAQEMPLAAGRT